MCVALTCARIHCLNCDAWDSGIAMIFRSHRPDRDSTPCFSLEQASMSKSQHGLVRAELNARARGRKGLCQSICGFRTIERPWIARIIAV